MLTLIRRYNIRPTSSRIFHLRLVSSGEVDIKLNLSKVFDVRLN